MNPKASNVEQGYASDAYPLATLLRPQPSLPALQAFLAVSHLGSLNKAALALCRTQGAVSRQIQQLEQHYHTVLFYRRVTGMQLTADGEALLPVATRVLTLLAGHAQRLAHSPQTWHLGLPATLAQRWFLPRLAALQQQLPSVALRISTSVSDTPDLDDQDIDVFIARGRGEWPGQQASLLFAEHLTPMCSPALAAGLAMPDDLTRFHLLHAGHARQEWQGWLAQAGLALPASQHVVVDSLGLALDAAAIGHGVAMGDPRMAQDQLASGALVMPFPELIYQDQCYYLLVPAGRQCRPGLPCLVNALMALVQDVSIPA